MHIKFQTALIAGGSRGLGRQIAVKLATEGVKKIAVHYRTGKSDAETTLSLVEAEGASGVLVQGDVADAVVAENVVNEAAQKLGGCDIFVQSVCPPRGGDLSTREVDGAFVTEVATRIRYTGTRILSWCAEGGKFHARWRKDHWAVVYPRWEDRWLA